MFPWRTAARYFILPNSISHSMKCPEEGSVAKILYTWELGGGLGHIVPYIPLANRLRESGHEILFVLHDLKNAESTLGRHGIPYMQAPTVLGTVDGGVEYPHLFAQILHNVGYGNVGLLTGMTMGWRQLVEQYRPDLILYNHSPTALLATRDVACKKIIIGTGFHMPPDSATPIILRDKPRPDMQQLQADNARILGNINQVLKQFNAAPLARVTQLYQSDEKIVLSFREMDHYPERHEQDISYWGCSSSDGGITPVWPKGNGKRIFAYLKGFNTLPALLTTLNRLQTPTIIYAPDVSGEIKQKFSSHRVSFSHKPVAMGEVSGECDVAITNATHATATSILLAGKPQLMLPLQLEQGMVARNVERLGAGLSAPRLHPQMMEQKLIALLNEGQYTSAAETFAASYQGYDPVEMETRLAAHIDALL
jgi:hypothetical protein